MIPNPPADGERVLVGDYVLDKLPGGWARAWYRPTQAECRVTVSMVQEPDGAGGYRNSSAPSITISRSWSDPHKQTEDVVCRPI